ncbi:hypothetical protein HY639_03570 [Candidatus Woesearchaeota archaeon]|nr:hypothetical protein [Candidatus Woesearchaeota archaeon]
MKLRQYVCDETYAKKQESFGRGLWVGSLSCDSGLDGSSILNGGRVRGVRREGVPAERAAPLDGLDGIMEAITAGRQFEFKGKVYVPIDLSGLKKQ